MSETIDVGPVYCPTCKREFGNTEAEALRKALRIAVDIASEAVGRLGKIGNIYSSAYAADITETEALTQMEVALRGAPPEGDIGFYVLAERLAAVRELVDLGEEP